MIGVGLSPTRVQGTSSVPAAFAASTLYMDFTTGTYRGATPANFTITRASTGYAETAAGVWTLFGNNVPRITSKGLLVEETRTNNIRNNSMQGAVAGTPGTLPTNWTANATPAGITRQIIGTGVDQGIEYIEIRYSGTAGATSSANIFFDGYASPTAAAATGQTWSASVFVKIISNSGSPVVLSSAIDEFNSGGAYLTGAQASQTAPSVGAAFVRLTQIRTLTDATVARAAFDLRPTFTNGLTYDYTIRIGWPQFELGASVTSPIRTTAGSITRSGDLISLAGANFTSWFTGGTSGTMFAEFTHDQNQTSGFPGYFTLDDGTGTGTAVQIFLNNAANTPSAEVQVGGAGQYGIGGGVHANGSVVRAALSFAPGGSESRFSVNGQAPGFATGASSVTGLTTARIGGLRGGGNQCVAYISRIAYIPAIFTREDLSILTLQTPTLDMDFVAGRYIGATPASLTVSRASTGYAEDTAGNWTLFGNNVARITDKGLLVEDTRTNLIPNSAGTGGTIGAINSSPTGWDGFASSGLTRTFAGRGVENGMDYVDLRYYGTTTNSFIVHAFANPAIATTAASTYTHSVFYKLVAGAMPAGNFGIQFRWNGGGDPANSLNLTTPDGSWRRGVHTLAAPASTVSCFPAWYTSGMTVGVAVDFTIRFAWPQFELGPFATSPIPTTSGALARQSDVITLQSTAFTSWYTNAAAGTHFAEAILTNAPASNAFLSDINDGTNANGMGSYYSVSGTFLTHLINSGGVTQAAPLVGGLSLGNMVRTALSYAANDMQAAYNGALMTQDTSNTVPTVNRITLGARGDNTFRLNGYLRRVTYYPVRLSDSNIGLMTLTDPTLDMNFVGGSYVGATSASLTVTRASTAYANNAAGVWSLFGNNIARITDRGLLAEEGRTNSIRNNSMQGVVAGTPGTFPTNWGGGTNGSGAAWSVVGTGTESGIDYVDLRLSGTVTVGNESFLYFDGTTAIAASNGQTWTDSAFVRIISETSGSLTSLTMGLASRIAGGGGGSWNPRGTNQVTNSRSATNITNNRVVFTGTISDASAAFVWPLLYFVPTVGALDVVVRVGWPQCELGAFATSPIRTTSAAVARSPDQISLTGAGFTPWFTSSTAYTLYAEGISSISTNANPNNAYMASLSVIGGSLDNRVAIFRPGASLDLQYRNVAATVQTNPGAFVPVSGFQTGGIVRTAIATAVGTNAARAAQGGTLSTAASPAAMPTGINQLTVGCNEALSGLNFNGYIRRVNYRPMRIVDVALQRITTP